MTTTGAPRERTETHTRILRVMLAVPDCVAYWKAPSDGVAPEERVRAAFEGHWFGAKSEARVKTLLGDMALRFDAYPHALAALKSWRPPSSLAPWICHFHTQLADPIYRRFTGEYVPRRAEQGYSKVDRETVARWVAETWPDRWSPVTCMKFGSNMLATAHEAGLFPERRDPRSLKTPTVPQRALEYALYLLRGVEIEAPLLDSPYVASVARDPEDRARAVRALPSVHWASRGDVHELAWDYADLPAWANAQQEAA